MLRHHVRLHSSLPREECKPDRTYANVMSLPAGIPWLINTYKQYVLMRERLLNDTQQLRTKLQHSIPESSFPGTWMQRWQHIDICSEC